MKTQKDIATHLNISQSYFSLIISGRRNARYPLAKKMAEYFDTPITIWMDPAKVIARQMASNSLNASNVNEIGD